MVERTAGVAVDVERRVGIDLNIRTVHAEQQVNILRSRLDRSRRDMVAARIRLVRLGGDEYARALLHKADVAADGHGGVGDGRARRDVDAQFRRNLRHSGRVEVLELDQLQPVVCRRRRERNTVPAVGGIVLKRVRAYLLRCRPCLRILRVESRPVFVGVVRSLERPNLRAARVEVAQWSDVNLIHIDSLGIPLAEVVCDCKGKFCFGHENALRVAAAHVVVVEEVDR